MYIVTMLGQKGKREKGPAKIIIDPKISVYNQILTIRSLELITKS